MDEVQKASFNSILLDCDAHFQLYSLLYILLACVYLSVL
jgi:hypothetical protein